MSLAILQREVGSVLKLNKTLGSALNRLKIDKVIHLLSHLPFSYKKKLIEPKLQFSIKDSWIVISLRLISIEKVAKTFRIHACTSYSEDVEIVFFHSIPKFMYRFLGKKVQIEGQLKIFRNSFQLYHPNINYHNEEVLAIEPIYPLTAKIKNSTIHKLILNAIDILPEIEEFNPLAQENNWPSFRESLNIIHNPRSRFCIKEVELSKTRLATDELISYQLALKKTFANILSERQVFYPKAEIIQKNILDSLSFKLTQGQENALKVIEEQQVSSNKFICLLQGDVGSGKTLVALFAAINVIDSGRQVAFMVPTELLARQHYIFFTRALSKTNFKITLLTGKQTVKTKQHNIAEIKNNMTDIVIGTHALFQDSVIFHNLGLTIIDEQHRFGVHQRMALLNKGIDNQSDLLLITATPIPRSLATTFFQEISVSKIDNTIQGRKDIITIYKSLDKVEEVITSIGRKVDKNEKVFWICPLIHILEESKLMDVESRYNILSQTYGSKVGFLHGKMPQDIQLLVMRDFKYGKLDILVSTTVIEVGIDVSEATLIIIENADNFGLSQLHQLRGRVGRGEIQSHCILLCSDNISESGKERLSSICKSNDGFFLAEKDLEIRGAGEILGTKQSGSEKWLFVEFNIHTNMIPYTSKVTEELFLSKSPVIEKIFSYIYCQDYTNYVL